MAGYYEMTPEDLYNNQATYPPGSYIFPESMNYSTVRIQCVACGKVDMYYQDRHNRARHHMPRGWKTLVNVRMNRDMDNYRECVPSLMRDQDPFGQQPLCPTCQQPRLSLAPAFERQTYNLVSGMTPAQVRGPYNLKAYGMPLGPRAHDDFVCVMQGVNGEWECLDAEMVMLNTLDWLRAGVRMLEPQCLLTFQYHLWPHGDGDVNIAGAGDCLEVKMEAVLPVHLVDLLITKIINPSPIPPNRS